MGLCLDRGTHVPEDDPFLQQTDDIMPTLDEIAKKYGTDKSSRYHNYAQFYDRIFSKLRDRGLCFLEVGIGTVVSSAPSNMEFFKNYKPGASLRMWSEYFSAESTICGIDTQSDCMFREGNILTALADSRCPKSVATALSDIGCGSFEIILDDGLHEQDANVKTLQSLMRYLSPSGVYIIEDVRKPWSILARLQTLLPSHVFHVETLAKLAPKKKIPDSNIVIVLPEADADYAVGTAAYCVKEALLQAGGLNNERPFLQKGGE